MTNLLTKDKHFWAQVEQIVRQVNQEARLLEKDELKEQKTKYPWNNIELGEILEEISSVIAQKIDYSLHEILNN